ncbi:hypothetical protein N0V82_009268 [Gnomoniopsis sp. IMI 355080]|nr:hypothetical protein N0V82_009268 [Gnomoniopsis sp. IMI 355080]
MWILHSQPPPPVHHTNDTLKLVFTITTDLGDSFLNPEQPLPISVHASDLEQESPNWTKYTVKIDDGSVKWRSGLRVLKIDLQLPVQISRKLRAAQEDNSSPSIRISASRNSSALPNIAEIPFDTQGRILGLSVPLPRPGKEACFTATRELLMSFEGANATLRIDEEIGESIDRHVWDAGIVTTGLIFDMYKAPSKATWTKTPLLRSILGSATSERPLHVIELGCGVGILGIGLATALSAEFQTKALDASPEEAEYISASNGTLDNSGGAVAELPEVGSILLTDLPDAEELTRRNILRYSEGQQTLGPEIASLDFESLDWEDGKNGIFGPKANATGWDLIIISDCTYNVDMLSALVETLSRLHSSSMALAKTEPKVMLATKPRHPSEKALFDLMAASGWEQLESANQPLPSIGLEDESVEIYLFGKAPEKGSDGGHISSLPAKRRRLG